MTDKPQAKRIVMCFDGTAQQIGAGSLTNVAKIFEMVEKNDPASQLAYYDPGVGTLAPESSSLIGKLTLFYEQAFGKGLKHNVAQAYRYLMQHWRPGDGLETERVLWPLLYECRRQGVPAPVKSAARRWVVSDHLPPQVSTASVHLTECSVWLQEER